MGIGKAEFRHDTHWYNFKWQSGIEITIDKVSGAGANILGELVLRNNESISSHIIGPVKLLVANPAARQNIIRDLEKYEENKERKAEWRAYITYACDSVVYYYQLGEPFQVLNKMPKTEPSKMFIARFIPQDGTTILSGDGGCISGDTIVHGPELHERVDVLAKRGQPIEVWSMGSNGPIRAVASAPFIAGVAKMRTFHLSDGKSICVAPYHKFLTENGWTEASFVSVGDTIACEQSGYDLFHSYSNSGTFPSMLCVNALRSMQRVRGFQDHYFQCYHRYDARLHLGVNTFQSSAPSLTYVREHSRCDRQTGDPDISQGCNLYRSQHGLHYRSSFSPHGPLVVDEECYGASLHAKQHCDYNQAPMPSLRDSTDHLPTLLSDRLVTEAARVYRENGLASPTPDFRCLNHATIIATEDNDYQPYYDLTVPYYENYLGGGIWNHNSLKSTIAIALCLTVMSGKTIIPGLKPLTQRGPVMYLDWESSMDDIIGRMHSMAEAYAIDIDSVSDFVYRPMYGAYTNDARVVKEECEKRGIRFLCVDSLGYAVEHSSQSGGLEGATRFMNALRSLGSDCPRLCIGHVAKGNADKEGRMRTIGCYADGTDVLTSNGWIRHKDVSINDTVLCFNLATSSLEWNRPSYIHQYEYDGNMVRVKNKTYDCLITPGHNMILRRDLQRHRNGKDCGVPITPWEKVQATASLKSKWKLPIAAPMEVDYPDIPVSLFGSDPKSSDSLLRLIGWWISEGTTNCGGLLIGQREGCFADDICKCLDAVGLEYNTYHYIPRGSRSHELPMRYMRTRNSRDWHDWMVENCGSGAQNKFLPELTWKLSSRQKLVLLSSLIDGDGSRNSTGSMRYHTTSKKLADDVQRLCIESGLAASISCRGKPPKGNYDAYNVNISPPWRTESTVSSDKQFGYLSEEHYKGNVYCLTVPTGAYVTRYNGKIMISGNSTYQELGSRMVWEIRKLSGNNVETDVDDTDYDDDEDVPWEDDPSSKGSVDLKLSNTKANGTQLLKAIRLSVQFDGPGKPKKIIRVKGDATNDEQYVGTSLQTRIFDLLNQFNTLPIFMIAEYTHSDSNEVQHALQHSNAFVEFDSDWQEVGGQERKSKKVWGIKYQE